MLKTVRDNFSECIENILIAIVQYMNLNYNLSEIKNRVEVMVYPLLPNLRNIYKWMIQLKPKTLP